MGLRYRRVDIVRHYDIGSGVDVRPLGETMETEKPKDSGHLQVSVRLKIKGFFRGGGCSRGVSVKSGRNRDVPNRAAPIEISL